MSPAYKNGWKSFRPFFSRHFSLTAYLCALQPLTKRHNVIIHLQPAGDIRITVPALAKCYAIEKKYFFTLERERKRPYLSGHEASRQQRLAFNPKD
ncbi:hypothetical protein ED28_05835 [[Pantoea] beijingensis]|uniref:Uncharacterized protein n=1 Tax=[Pantoea] beijingensis TaxID=1324864 RepID=A0A443IFM8_9GAMM|nr:MULTISPECIES: hypothetical protein [Erwiniaceae]RWR02841.1 hypothetical protein ED28_05835 [[Pantoea] beijingensis]